MLLSLTSGIPFLILISGNRIIAAMMRYASITNIVFFLNPFHATLLHHLETGNVPLKCTRHHLAITEFKQIFYHAF